MKKAIAYIRISTTDQSNFSLPGQEMMVRNWCQQNGIELLEVFCDNGASAKNFDRPDWKRLHDFVKRHYRNINMLVLSKYDRFSRNLKEALTNIELFETNYSILIISASEPINLHPDSPYYFKFRTDYLTGAHLERLIIADRTRSGIRTANMQGRYVNMAPFGYKNSRDAQNKPVIVIDEAKAAVIASMFNMIITGNSMAEIKRFAAANGYGNKHKSAVLRTLQNPIYAGLIQVKKMYDKDAEMVPGIHQPIVSRAIFEAAQNALNPRRLVRYKSSRYFYLRGLVKCNECNRNLTAAFSRGKKIKVGYYFCHSHRSNNINTERAHAALHTIMEQLSFSTDTILQIKEAVLLRFEDYNRTRRADLATKEQKLIATQTKLRNLEEKFIMNDIEKDVYRNWRTDYLAAINELVAQIALLKKPMNDLLQVIEDNLYLLNNISFLFAAATTEQKQQLLKLVFDNGITYNGEVYRTRYVNEAFLSKLPLLAASGVFAYEGNQQLEGVIEGCTQPLPTIEPLLPVISLLSSIKNFAA